MDQPNSWPYMNFSGNSRWCWFWAAGTQVLNTSPFNTQRAEFQGHKTVLGSSMLTLHLTKQTEPVEIGVWCMSRQPAGHLTRQFFADPWHVPPTCTVQFLGKGPQSSYAWPLSSCCNKSQSIEPHFFSGAFSAQALALEEDSLFYNLETSCTSFSFMAV